MPLTPVVSYERVSTDRKQDPNRQGEEFNQPYAKANGLKIIATISDKGTSAYTVSPFEREKFREAIAIAVSYKAKAILVEGVDRLTREGPDMLGWVRIELLRRHGLEIILADQGPPDQQGGFIGDLTAHTKASLAFFESEQKARRTREGMARAIAKGVKLGAPEKKLPKKVVEEIIHRKDVLGQGWRKIAHWVSKDVLKAFEVADPKLQKRKSVSFQHIRRVYFRAKGLEQRCEECRRWFNAVKYPRCPKCKPEPVTNEQALQYPENKGELRA